MTSKRLYLSKQVDDGRVVTQCSIANKAYKGRNKSSMDVLSLVTQKANMPLLRNFVSISAFLSTDMMPRRAKKSLSHFV
jgi:hypothetical protein